MSGGTRPEPGGTTTAQPLELPEHYFRHEFGRLVSVLSRRYGSHRIELCEDAAQAALLRALQLWPSSAQPDDRGAWLYRVANNHLLDALRRDRRNEPYPAELEPAAEGSPADEVHLESEMKDDVLRLLFVCADPALPAESQLVLALKTLCGFSTQEIALRLFQSEEGVHKRLQRARAKLREFRGDNPHPEQPPELDTPRLEQLADRLPGVLHALYLLFNEGYSSGQPDQPIRRELCEEAIRLTLLLITHPVGSAPETDALLALMYLHAARFDARLDLAGGLLTLEEQDRTRWDQQLIQLGVHYLQRAARGERFSRYHAEAAIAAEHCLAPSYAQTRWDEITRAYELLDRIAPSPLNTLNRAIALAEWQGAGAGLALLEALERPSWLLGYYLWDATLGELQRRNGDLPRATAHLSRALELAPTRAEKALLERRLKACGEGS
jgi:RNA polymerase sigma-70 factor (ECF subfamily)